MFNKKKSPLPIYKPYHAWCHFKELSSLYFIVHFIRMLWYEKYYCEYMYCLYTEKRKMSVENITFYLLKSVQNINNSSRN